jgi:hypothetical protein
VNEAERNLEALRRWSETYEQEGVEAALALVDEIYDPEVEFSPLLAREVEGRTLRGRDELRSFFRDLTQTLEGARYEGTELHPVAPDTIVLFTRLIGSGRGSTVPIGQELGLVYEFEDGLIRRVTAYGSRDEAMSKAREAQRA